MKVNKSIQRLREEGWVVVEVVMRTEKKVTMQEAWKESEMQVICYDVRKRILHLRNDGFMNLSRPYAQFFTKGLRMVSV